MAIRHGKVRHEAALPVELDKRLDAYLKAKGIGFSEYVAKCLEAQLNRVVPIGKKIEPAKKPAPAKKAPEKKASAKSVKKAKK